MSNRVELLETRIAPPGISVRQHSGTMGIYVAQGQSRLSPATSPALWIGFQRLDAEKPPCDPHLFAGNELSLSL